MARTTGAKRARRVVVSDDDDGGEFSEGSGGDGSDVNGGAGGDDEDKEGAGGGGGDGAAGAGDGRVPVPLYGEWQTEPYEPPAVVGGVVPRNGFGNIELWGGAVPRGGAHVVHPHALAAAARLGISHAPAVVRALVCVCACVCVRACARTREPVLYGQPPLARARQVAFEHRGGRPYPRREGIVVAAGNEAMLVEACEVLMQSRLETEAAARAAAVARRWALLVRKLLIRAQVREHFRR